MRPCCIRFLGDLLQSLVRREARDDGTGVSRECICGRIWLIAKDVEGWHFHEGGMV